MPPAAPRWSAALPDEHGRPALGRGDASPTSVRGWSKFASWTWRGWAPLTIFLGAPVEGEPPPEGWRLNQSAESCVLFTHVESGTTLGLVGDDDPSSLTFLLQNPAWRSLKRDTGYQVLIEFDNNGEWPVSAVGATDIDRDGPGLVFTRSTATTGDGDNFLIEFARASTMRVRLRSGVRVDSLRLRGADKATLALLGCMRALITEGGRPKGGSEQEQGEAPVAI